MTSRRWSSQGRPGSPRARPSRPARHGRRTPPTWPPWRARRAGGCSPSCAGPPVAPGASRLWPPPHPLDLAFVTVYANGRLCGCVGGPAGGVDGALRSYAVAAARDTRFTPAQEGDEIAVSVSLLSNRHEMGAAPPDWAIGPTRAAEQVLEVSQGDRKGLLLPFVAVMNNLTPLEYAYEVIDKAGITRPPYYWTRYDCTTWLASGQGVRRLRNALPEGAAAPAVEAELERLRRLFVGYTRRHHVVRGDPVARYEVFADRLRTGLVPARLAYGAWVKARAGLRREAGDDVRRLDRARQRDGWIRLDDHPPTVSELAFLLLARLELGKRDATSAQIASQLWGQVDHHGRLATHRDPAAADPAYQDYAPGHVLLALAWAAERGVCEVRPEVLARALRYYRMRFRQGHQWGAATWLMLAFTAWGRVGEDPALTSFAYEVADWALPFQSQKTGGILNDHQPDAPGATTAVYLEGLAEVWAAAQREGDRRRQQRYRSACERAVLFLDELVYQRRDTVVLPNPSWAIGGLRTSRTTSQVRIDHVHHGLSAVLSMRAAIKEG
ncbi:MAG: AMMECR1 domain-containing protein [Actinobacteria bacterium]|nr:AMMECR1 domain-containing protein [Actinomycetota bacterium]